jgi:hypothetical protein
MDDLAKGCRALHRFSKRPPLRMECVAAEAHQIFFHEQSVTADIVITPGMLHVHVPHVNRMQTSLYTLIDWQRRDPLTYPYPRIRLDDALPRLSSSS